MTKTCSIESVVYFLFFLCIFYIEIEKEIIKFLNTPYEKNNLILENLNM